VCTVSTSIDDDPLSSIKNSANDTLNEADINHLKSTKHRVLPKPDVVLCCIALFDNCEEQRLWFLEIELWCSGHINLHDLLKFSKERASTMSSCLFLDLMLRSTVASYCEGVIILGGENRKCDFNKTHTNIVAHEELVLTILGEIP